MPELKAKPCPFCGNMPAAKACSTPNGVYYSVGCESKKCLVQPFTPAYKTLAPAVRVWNKRVK